MLVPCLLTKFLIYQKELRIRKNLIEIAYSNQSGAPFFSILGNKNRFWHEGLVAIISAADQTRQVFPAMAEDELRRNAKD